MFAKHENIEIPSKDTRHQRRPPSTLNKYVVTADTIGSCDETVISSLSDHYKTVYFATLDVVIVKMNERFSERNLTLMKAIDALCLKSDSFLSVVKLEHFLYHYRACLPPLDNLENEINTFKNYLTLTGPMSHICDTTTETNVTNVSPTHL